MYRVGIVIGTRPEAIKLAPLVRALQETDMTPVVIMTGQHDTLMAPVADFFGLRGDHVLGVMVPGQSLAALHANLLHALDGVMSDVDAVVVQGDTTSALAGAMAAFYHHRPVFHVEAGLRTASIKAPFPEEWNRRVIDEVATLRFAPTQQALDTLRAEGRGDGAWLVGNTVIDALQMGLDLMDAQGDTPYRDWAVRQGLLRRPHLMLVTTHRRENAGEPLQHIIAALRQLVVMFPDVEIVLPVHQNPAFKPVITGALQGVPGIALVDPLPYDQLLWLLRECRLVLTDSGGLQEEAPALHKPVLVMRDETERPEGVAAGCARCIGTRTDHLVAAVTELLTQPTVAHQMATAINPYGDGTACQQIVSHIHAWRNQHA
ncbi:UDP-N-acetylglucosamine 2-epimerase (non-hydrolyzing) [bacterium]|nr:UDP-N-acetylglucosamine 2-epimerase (non-hydrolyzing) [bacterium]